MFAFFDLRYHNITGCALLFIAEIQWFPSVWKYLHDFLMLFTINVCSAKHRTNSMTQFISFYFLSSFKVLGVSILYH
jgi:hypothetical protein